MILCYGSLGPDIEHRLPHLPRPGEDLPSQSWRMSYGGGAAHPAVALAAWGREAAVAGQELGDDPLGRWLLAELQARGVETTRVAVRRGAATPHCVVLGTPDGERTIVSSGYGGLRWQEVTSWGDVEAMIVDGYSGSAGVEQATRARRRGIPVVGVDVVEVAAPSTDWVVWSRHEHPHEEEADRAADRRVVVVTDGPRPVIARAAGRRLTVQPPQVEVTDSTGAGHLFAALCALGLVEGWTLERTLGMATAGASLLAAFGRVEGVPSLDSVERAAAALNVRSTQ